MNTKIWNTVTEEKLEELKSYLGKGHTCTCPIQFLEGQRGDVFPLSSVANVQGKDGLKRQKKMANLEVGDMVMGWDEKRNRTIFTKIIMFAHHASDVMNVEYLQIALEDGNKITLSDNHLVMVGRHNNAILAGKVKPGDILFSVNENQEISPKKVLAVEKVTEQGIYCPITLRGNLIVDNVLASCYASVEDHAFFGGLSSEHSSLWPYANESSSQASLEMDEKNSKWSKRAPVLGMVM